MHRKPLEAMGKHHLLSLLGYLNPVRTSASGVMYRNQTSHMLLLIALGAHVEKQQHKHMP